MQVDAFTRRPLHSQCKLMHSQGGRRIHNASRCIYKAAAAFAMQVDAFTYLILIQLMIATHPWVKTRFIASLQMVFLKCLVKRLWSAQLTSRAISAIALIKQIAAIH